MYNMYYFSFWYRNSHLGCIIEASTEKEAVEIFWKTYPQAINAQCNGVDIDE